MPKPAPKPNIYDLVLAEPVPLCMACGAALSVVRRPEQVEVYNEVLLSLGGGYGSFTDDLVSDGPRQLVICEACAMRVCRTLGWHAPIREHHTSTVCECPDRPARDEHGFPRRCDCADCVVDRAAEAG